MESICFFVSFGVALGVPGRGGVTFGDNNAVGSDTKNYPPSPLTHSPAPTTHTAPHPTTHQPPQKNIFLRRENNPRMLGLDTDFMIFIDFDANNCCVLLHLPSRNL